MKTSGTSLAVVASTLVLVLSAASLAQRPGKSTDGVPAQRPQLGRSLPQPGRAGPVRPGAGSPIAQPPAFRPGNRVGGIDAGRAPAPHGGRGKGFDPSGTRAAPSQQQPQSQVSRSVTLPGGGSVGVAAGPSGVTVTTPAGSVNAPAPGSGNAPTVTVPGGSGNGGSLPGTGGLPRPGRIEVPEIGSLPGNPFPRDRHALPENPGQDAQPGTVGPAPAPGSANPGGGRPDRVRRPGYPVDGFIGQGNRPQPGQSGGSPNPNPGNGGANPGPADNPGTVGGNDPGTTNGGGNPGGNPGNADGGSRTPPGQGGGMGNPGPGHPESGFGTPSSGSGGRGVVISVGFDIASHVCCDGCWTWLEAGSEIVVKQPVWVPEHTERRWVEGSFVQTRRDARGRTTEVHAEPSLRDVVVPGHYEERDEVVVLAEGRWVKTCGH